jgi:hypothetical protein
VFSAALRKTVQRIFDRLSRASRSPGVKLGLKLRGFPRLKFPTLRPPSFREARAIRTALESRDRGVGLSAQVERNSDQMRCLAAPATAKWGPTRELYERQALQPNCVFRRNGPVVPRVMAHPRSEAA